MTRPHTECGKSLSGGVVQLQSVGKPRRLLRPRTVCSESMWAVRHGPSPRPWSQAALGRVGGQRTMVPVLRKKHVRQRGQDGFWTTASRLVGLSKVRGIRLWSKHPSLRLFLAFSGVRWSLCLLSMEKSVSKRVRFLKIHVEVKDGPSRGRTCHLGDGRGLCLYKTNHMVKRSLPDVLSV